MSEPGLRERKNRRTRLAIVQATVELTREHGYAYATIPRIAERADVSPRTVSGWFPAKDQILFGEDARRPAEDAVRHLRRGDGDAVDRIAAWLAAEGEREPVDPELARLRLEAIEADPALRARDREGYEVIGNAVGAAAARDLGVDDGDLGPRLFAGAVVAMLQGLRASTQTHGRDELAPHVARGLAQLRAILDGLRAVG